MEENNKQEPVDNKETKEKIKYTRKPFWKQPINKWFWIKAGIAGAALVGTVTFVSVYFTQDRSHSVTSEIDNFKFSIGDMNDANQGVNKEKQKEFFKNNKASDIAINTDWKKELGFDINFNSKGWAARLMKKNFYLVDSKNQPFAFYYLKGKMKDNKYSKVINKVVVNAAADDLTGTLFVELNIELSEPKPGTTDQKQYVHKIYTLTGFSKIDETKLKENSIVAKNDILFTAQELKNQKLDTINLFKDKYQKASQEERYKIITQSNFNTIYSNIKDYSFKFGELKEEAGELSIPITIERIIKYSVIENGALVSKTKTIPIYDGVTNSDWKIDTKIFDTLAFADSLTLELSSSINNTTMIDSLQANDIALNDNTKLVNIKPSDIQAANSSKFTLSIVSEENDSESGVFKIIAKIKANNSNIFIEKTFEDYTKFGSPLETKLKSLSLKVIVNPDFAKYLDGSEKTYTWEQIIMNKDEVGKKIFGEGGIYTKQTHDINKMLNVIDSATNKPVEGAENFKFEIVNFKAETNAPKFENGKLKVTLKSTLKNNDKRGTEVSLQLD